MAEQPGSGFDSLIDALRRSGLDVDKFSDPAGEGEEETPEAEATASASADDGGDVFGSGGASFFGIPLGGGGRRDLLLLRKMLIGLPPEDAIVAPDVNGDGSFDIRDLVRMRRILAAMEQG